MIRKKLRFLPLLTALLSLSLGLLSCDSGSSSSSSSSSSVASDPTAEGVRIDPDLQPYLNTFLQEASNRGVTLPSGFLDNLTLRFEDIPPRTLGTCATDPDNPDVEINSRLRGTDPEWTVIHELGHCILRMEHRDEVLSIMNTFDRSAELEAADRTTLFDEFFQPALFNQF